MKIALQLLSLVILTSCNKSYDNLYNKIQDDHGELAISIPQDHLGKELMQNNCYLCHNPKTSEESIIAPPMVLVKASYMENGISKNEFIDAMVSWVKNPNEESSKMPDAIKEYGLMPYQFYSENTLRQIADYMFDNEIEEPEWFKLD